MGLPAGKELDVLSFSDVSGGVNLNDPAISLSPIEVQSAINALFLKTGFKRWPGAVNLTTKDAVNDVFRGQFHHAEIDGTQHLFEMHGGKLYEVNKTTGALTELYDLTGTGEAWGGSHWGKFFVANGSAVAKVEGSTAYKVGIDAPTTGSAGGAFGGTLPAGEYDVYISYARKVSGINVLYSVGNYLTSAGKVTLTEGANQTIRITGFANSTDPQVNNKVVWLSGPNDAGVVYYYGETDDNTTTTVDITSADDRNTSIVYEVAAAQNFAPENFEFLHVFDNRVWGSVGNVLYYSKKAFSEYDLEKFPILNRIEYPYQITGLFSLGTSLYINTKANGVIIQPTQDIAVNRYEHYEQKHSFSYMRTVAEWNGKKYGLTDEGVMEFDGIRFREADYGFNVRQKLEEIYNNADADHQPCGFIFRRENRVEYAISFMDTTINTITNNRTYVLNLSQTFWQDSNNYKTPWEIVGRGFNYVSVDNDNTVFYAQSKAGSSTIYKENATETTQVGLYNDDGVYIETETDMLCRVIYRTIIQNMFTKMIIEELRALFALSFPGTIKIVVADDVSKSIQDATDIEAYGVSYWDDFLWSEDYWSNTDQYQYGYKAKQGTFGYSWYLIFEQTANDPTMQITQFDVLVTNETGRQI